MLRLLRPHGILIRAPLPSQLDLLSLTPLRHADAGDATTFSGRIKVQPVAKLLATLL